jgi:hypothetical protein
MGQVLPQVSLLYPIFTAVNCITFDMLSRLTGPDVDLFFATNRCFACHHAVHHTENCPQRSLGMLFCKYLDDPHRESISCFFTDLADDGV